MCTVEEKEEQSSLQSHVIDSGTSEPNSLQVWSSVWRQVGPYIVLLMCLLASGFTFIASWSCNTFYGADLPWMVGGGYGIWSLQDSQENCQLWSVLFFAYTLDAPLRAARFCSMVAMLLSLTSIALLTQVTPRGRVASWVVAVRCALVDKFPKATLWLFGTRLFLICCGFSSGIFLILLSNVCTCEKLSEEDLEQVSEFFERPDHCSGECVLGPTSQTAIATPMLWLTAFLMSLCVSVEQHPRWDHSHQRLRLNTASTFTGEDEADESKQGAIADAAKEEGQNESTSLPSGSSDTPDSAADDTTEVKTCTWEGPDACNKGSTTPEGEEDDPSSSERKKLPFYRRCERYLLVVVVGCFMFLTASLLGSYFENRNAARAPDTSYNFITDVVCAFHPLDASLPFQSFNSTDEATIAGYVVAHCGECGECSNPLDIETYVATRQTVANSAKSCGVKAIFGSDGDLVDCLEDAIGFSRDCTVCWAENMKSTAKYCMWTCLSSMLNGLMESNNVVDANAYDWLNQCIYCDEKRSGPNFVECSGVARRRLGIQSEIERNPSEQCHSVDFDYINDDLSLVFPQPSTVDGNQTDGL
eukprot:Nitzschia sp. Nitz4//scaffold49_size126201//79543//81405//NITZ4_003650-RA/size126201-snap-gene-0.53-mRNA-1//1//CDS//3329553173//75//frame0